MKTIQMTIDDELLVAVDDAVATIETTRSAFIRDALRAALLRFEIQQLERQHAAGYAHKPVEAGEFDIWEAEQAWSES
ncbi:MAG: CopG family transcriptional regulator [Anaerolineae bacterium]|nr:CopG family transcriptional regulator [Anaerolineae bacterium]MCO5196949.1 CopG family transcriptional regulator [Anaerolineae bacterium]